VLPGTSTHQQCPGPIVFQQYLALVHPHEPQGSSAATQAMAGLLPVPLSVTLEPRLYPMEAKVKEKNWMPFVHRNKLHMVHSISPTRIFQFNSSGHSSAGFFTDPAQLLAQCQLPTDGRLHGGPPLLPMRTSMQARGLAGRSKGRRARSRHAAGAHQFYLGVLHYFDFIGPEMYRQYHHFFFTMQNKPPFSICSVSAEILLHEVNTADVHTKYLAYVAGLHYNAAASEVVLSYGTADSQARLLVMPLSEVRGLFSVRPCACGPAAAACATSW
jgi:hypothetical protein